MARRVQPCSCWMLAPPSVWWTAQDALHCTLLLRLGLWHWLRHCWHTVLTRGFGTARVTRHSLWPAATATTRRPTCWRGASPSLLRDRRLHPARPTLTLHTPLLRCGSLPTADAGGQLTTDRFSMPRLYMQLQLQPSMLLWYRTRTDDRKVVEDMLHAAKSYVRISMNEMFVSETQFSREHSPNSPLPEEGFNAPTSSSSHN